MSFKTAKRYRGGRKRENPQPFPVREKKKLPKLNPPRMVKKAYQLKGIISRENIERMIRKSLRLYPKDTKTHGLGTWAIGSSVYKRTKIPISEIRVGNAIIIHTHGAKYPHSYGDVDDLRKVMLKKEGIAMVVLSPEHRHYYSLHPELKEENRAKLIIFLRLRPKEIKERFIPKTITKTFHSSVEREKRKLTEFANEYGLEFIEGYY